MTASIEIVESTANHARELTQTIREKDRLEAIRLGLDPKTCVFYAYRRAFYRKTGLINGKVAAMWGVVGAPFSYIGRPYLITGIHIEEISPIRFARIYKTEAEKMSKLYPILENLVDGDYPEAVKMLRLSGFEIEGSVILNNSVFYKYTKREV